jgi:hypothetical protein
MHYDYFKFRDKHKIDDAKLKDIQKFAKPAEKAPQAEAEQ